MKYAELMQQFQDEYKNRNFKGALKYIREATRREPEHPEAWLMLCNLYLLDFNRADLALNALKFAFRYHPKHARLLFLQADALLKVCRFEESLDSAVLILEQERENAQAWELMDKIYALAKQLRTRIDQIRLNLYQKDIDSGKIAIQSNKNAEAIKFFEHAIQINPSNLESAYELAQLYFKTGNFAASLNYIQQLSPKRANDENLMVLSAQNHTKLNDIHLAYDEYKKILTINPKNAEAQKNLPILAEQIAYEYIHKGDAHFHKKEYEDAIAEYNNVLKYLKADPQILQRIDKAQKALNLSSQQQLETEDDDLVNHLIGEAQICEEIDFEEVLQAMPPHREVKDKDSLRMVLKRLLQAKRIEAMLTPNSIKFTGMTLANQAKNQGKINPQSYKGSAKSLALRNKDTDLIVLREGMIQGDKFLYRIKIQNNSKRIINQIVIFSYFPMDCLKLPEHIPNPLFVPALEPQNIYTGELPFIMITSVLEGKIQTVVSYIDHNEELHVMGVSGYEIENITPNIQPLSLDPTSFAKMLLASQDYSKQNDEFILNKSILDAFQSVQMNLQALHFYIQKTIPPVAGADSSSYIYATGQSMAKNEPMLCEISLNQENPNATRINIKTSTTSQKISQIVARSVKSTLMMPKCPVCAQVFPITMLDKIKKGRDVICEVCGEPSRFPPS